MRGNRSRLLAAAAIGCWTAWGSTAHADWVSCQNKPTRDCLLEEAFRGDGGPLTGKDRLDVMIQGGAIIHPEYAAALDIAEAQRLAQSTGNIIGLNYALLAIRGLVASNQKQKAIDLVASLSGAAQTLSVIEIVRDLVKADDLETALALPDRMQPPLDPKARPSLRNDVTVVAAKALAEIGKTDQALMLMADQNHLTEANIADMQAAVGQAFAKRADAKLAEGFFDRAERYLDAARRYQIGPGADMQFRFAAVRIMALRGQAEAVNAALQQIRSSPEAAAPDARTDYERSQGYQRVVGALLEVKQPEAVAKSITPDTTKDASLAAVAVWEVANGRVSDARAVFYC